MARLLSVLLLACVLAAGCGTAQPSGTAPRSTTGLPAGATPGPYEGQPYALDLPAGWVAFDLSDPAGVVALDAFVSANPRMAAAIEAFKALPNVTMAVNLPLGNVVVSLAVPSDGLALDVIAASFTTQFAAVPGVVAVPEPDEVTVPAGPAMHWDLAIEANDPSGATYHVAESIYLVANDTTAVLVEFVEAGGAGIPQEEEIIQTLRFTP